MFMQEFQGPIFLSLLNILYCLTASSTAVVLLGKDNTMMPLQMITAELIHLLPKHQKVRDLLLERLLM